MFFVLAGIIVCLALNQAIATFGLQDTVMVAAPTALLAIAVPMILRSGPRPQPVPVRKRRISRPREDWRA